MDIYSPSLSQPTVAQQTSIKSQRRFTVLIPVPVVFDPVVVCLLTSGPSTQTVVWGEPAYHSELSGDPLNGAQSKHKNKENLYLSLNKYQPCQLMSTNVDKISTN